MLIRNARSNRRTRSLLSFLLGVAALSWGCAAGGMTEEVSPAELPSLEARVQRDPDNGDLLLRYGAALFAAERCDSAVAVTRRGWNLRPGNALGPLVVGQCLEKAENYDEALNLYAWFIENHGDKKGAATVRGRQLLARRARAAQLARQAIAREVETSQQPADPQVVAVLPLFINTDSSFQPLSRGLAQMITSDLAMLQRFRMVERVQLGAVLQELALSQTRRVDPNTAARVGNLVRAGQLVQGTLTAPALGQVRLEANVVRSTGEVAGPEMVMGRFRDLLSVEKDLVVGIARRMGYQLSLAERELILENGTRSLVAFLAYSRGLLAEDLGNYAIASVYYGEAIQADPNFQEAKDRREAAVTAPQTQQASPGQVTTLSTAVVPEPDFVVDPVGDALNGAVGDLAPTRAEQITEAGDEFESVQQATKQVAATSASQPPPPDVTLPPVTATIRIIFRIP